MHLYRTLFLLLAFICVGRAQQDSTIVFELNFELDSHHLGHKQKSKVDSILEEVPIAVLKSVSIYGHTDSLAGLEYNRQLSRKRVQSILTYLVYQGLDPIIVKADYFGEERPKYDNAPNTRALNRRVEVHLRIDPALLPPPEMKISDLPFNKGDKVRLPNLQFIGNQAIPMPESFDVLRQLLFTMQQYPDLQIELQGHVCCNDDQELSTARAAMVHDFLVGNGIDASRVSYKGFSNSRPLFKEKTEREKALNRRVEVLVIDNSQRKIKVEETNKPIDLRAPVMNIKFFPQKRRLYPSGDFMLNLIAEMMINSKDLYYEFVIFDNIKNKSLTTSRAAAMERALADMKVDRNIFNVRYSLPTSHMPVSENDNYLMVKISEK